MRDSLTRIAGSPAAAPGRRVARTRLALLLAVLAAGLTGAGGAPPVEPAPVNGFLVLSLYKTGYVSLGAFGQPAGTTVRFQEVVGRRRSPIATRVAGAAPIKLLRAVPWRCDRPVRHFRATATDPDGTRRTAVADVETPPCADRLAVTAPRRVAVGGLLRVTVVDRWRLGDRHVRLCVAGAVAVRGCRSVALAAGGAGVERRVRAGARGLVHLTVSLDRVRVRLDAASGPGPAPPRQMRPVVLATGDSTVEGVDSALAARLGASARVLADAHPGTRLSGDGARAWETRAAAQVVRDAPVVTVVSLGGNEGYDIAAPGATVACCGEDWVEALAAPVRHLMQTYGQDGRAVVVWTLLPAPRSAIRAPITAAVNRAAVRAARGLRGVRLFDQRPLFTPDGRFHDRVAEGGREVRVRAPDGIHLSAAGQAIAARELARMIRRDGLLRRPAPG